MANEEDRSTKKLEKEYYAKIKSKLEELFKTRYQDVHFEVTADGNFSNRLKSRVSRHRDIIFVFLKGGASPDITGFVNGLKEELRTRYSIHESFVVIEFKKDAIKLDDIYQTRKYAELLEARYAFLVSLEPIPEEIKRLSQTAFTLLALPIHETLTLTRFDDKSGNLTEFYPREPFE